MRGGARVVWLHRSYVYHHARYRHVWDNRWGADVTKVPCGVVVTSPLYRPQEATQRVAERFGLRPCRRCFPQPTYKPTPDATQPEEG